MRMPTRQVLLPTEAKKATEVTEEAIKEFKKGGLFIGSPAKIVRVDDYETLQCVDVQTLIQEEQDDGRVLPTLIIKKVFVLLPNAGDFKLSWPVKVGDLVTLCFSHKSLSNYLDSDGSEITQSRNFIQAPRDCWVELKGGTRRTNNTPSLTDLKLEGPETTLIIKPDGTIELTTVVINTNADSTTLTSPQNDIIGDVDIAGAATVSQTVDITGKMTAGSSELGSSVSTGGLAGITTTFIEHTGKTVTVTNGLITSVV